VSILYGTYTARVGVLCSTLLPNLRVPTSSYMMSPNATLRKHSIATIGADGIGPEVIDAGVQVLRKLAELDGTFALDFKDYDWSSDVQEDWEIYTRRWSSAVEEARCDSIRCSRRPGYASTKFTSDTAC
jgi:hypothetical protein